MNPVHLPCADRQATPAALANLRLVSLLAVLLAVLHVALAVTATIDKSPTFDEPTHLTAGYSYWLRKDFRLDAENGNLPARWAALPLLLSRPNFPAAESLPWKQGSVGQTSQRFFYRMGNNPDQVLLQGRIMMSAFSGALCLMIFFCSRRLFGTLGGLISETVAVFDPNLLAHGALVTADVASAFFFVAAVWSTWRLLQCVTIKTLIATLLGVAGLFLTKMSAPLFLLMAGLLGVMQIFSHQAIKIQMASFRRVVAGKGMKTVIVTTLTLIAGAAVVLSIWASFCFRFSALAETGQPRELLDARWDRLLAGHNVTQSTLAFARDYHLLPEAYLFGLSYVDKTSKIRPAFLDGKWSNVGFYSFFPRAFYYKTPLAVLFLIALAGFAAALRWKHRWRNARAPLSKIIAEDWIRMAPVWTLFIVYGAFALMTNLNIGHRHLLPIYPAIFIACGACAYFLRAERARLIGGIIAFLLCWQIIDSFQVRPDYLAYFNQAAGGPANGYRHLVDSSIDWGQDLPALKTWLDENKDQSKGGQVYLAYFGTAEPAWYGIDAAALPQNTSNETLLPLAPGIYCISATTLQHVYAIEQGKWAQPYENAYQIGLKLMEDYRKVDIDPSLRTAVFEKDASELRLRRVKIFQRLRFARLCAYLRHREPIANIGYSILVFRLTENDLREAVYGPPAELAPEIEVARPR
jgi:hypothetical protein